MINPVITLKWALLVITVIQVNADDTHGIEKRDTNGETTKRIVCYYTNWSVYRPGTAKFSPQNINPYLCTHLIYAFGGLDKENGLRPYDKYQDIEQGGYAKFTGLKTYNKNLKTMLAIGGWNEGSSRFSALVGDEERRAIFVKNVVKFLRQNNFDGLDLDWEYPAFRDGSKPADKENYASLVKELREEFEKESSKTGKPRLLLTMAVPAGIEYIDKGYDVPKLNRYLDFMNILSYDYHSAYEPNVNHHSPLYSLQEESEYNFDAQLTIDHTIKHYLKKGADREKLVLGIPTYGRSYTLFNADSTDLGSPADGPGEQGEATREKGYLAYYEICANLDGDKSWNVIQPKKSAMGPYAYRGNQWVSYDDADIVKLKAKYVNEKSLGGIMYWSIDNDDFRGKCHGKPYPLIEAGKESLLSSGGSSINAISSTSADEKRPSKLTNKRNRPKSQNVSTTTKQPSTTSATTTVTTAPNPLSTPEPPTTPDPGTDFVCKEEGFFPHPRDCKKYFWCLDSGPSNLGIVAHQFTCPSGLMFNKAADSCDYSRNVICNKKPEKTSSPTTTPTIKTTSKSPVSKPGTTTSSTTTTTTTTSEPSVEEYYEEEDADSQEDPKAIKQLITLIKKLGGIAELEKQLKLEDGSTEVTTPAISKNLYNKVFSSPTSSRHRNQNRNGPSGPQHEATASNNDVPYYRKDKPQYVTIQRSRPLKNVAQDTEDSGTTNNKSIEPSKYHDTVDYAEDDATESEPFTTVKYSTPTRYRSSTAADGRTTSLKYVVLERNKSDRITTSDEEPRAESPSTTQRYITLVRQRPSLTAATEYEEAITEPSTPQRTSPPVTEKVKEKVSEIETTYLPVTSAQYDTDKAQTLYTNEYSDTTANPPNTHLVYAQKAFGHGDELAVDTTTTLLGPTTETDLVPSTSTSVITTIRESPTEKTRLSLKRYKEYLKNNKTYLLHELRSNSVPDETLEHISPAQESSKGDSPLKKPYFSRKRPAFVSATSTTTTETSPLNKTQAFTLNSRFFSRRNKNTSESTTSPVEHTSTAESTRENSRTSAKSSDESSKENGDGNVLNTNSDKNTTNTSTYAPSSSKYRTPFRSRNQGTTIPESDSIGSFFKKRRFSTTEETYVDVTTSGSSSTAKGSRYFSRNRKTSPQTTESASTTNSPTTSTTAKYSRKNGGVLRKPAQSEILDSDENRYQISAQTSTTRQPSQTTTTTTTESTTTSTVEFHEFESPPKETRNNDSSTTGDVQDLGPEVEASSVATFKILRNNSRFLKNPESKRSEYVGVKGTRIRGETRYSTDDNDHRFSSPIRAIAHPNKNEIRVGVDTKEKLSSPSRAARDGNGDDSDVGTRRGRKKFFDNLKESTDVNATETTRADRQRSRHSQTITNSSANAEFKYEPMRRTRPIVVVASTASSTPSSPQHSVSYPNDHQARSRTLQTPSRNWNELATPPTTTQFHATAPATIDVHSRRRSKAQLFNVTDSAASKTTATTENTKRTVTRNRGKIKAQNSLSQAEIRELTSSSDAAAEMGIRKKPKPIVEETFVTNADSVQLQPNRGLYTLVPTLLERSFEETTDTDNTIYALDGNNNYEAYLKNNEIFGTSETKYSNIDNHLDEDDETTTTTADESETHFPSRYREHFRRTTSSSRSRSRPTTIATTTTTTTEYSPSNESAKLASRFRRRKIKPENRSIGNSKNENIVSSIHSTEISTTRPKSIDVSQRGSTTISDYLPVPASLYRVNNASNFDSYNVGSVNLEDLEAQTINTQSNYYNNEDVSDLADPAVVAIHNLKTVPPASSTVTVSRTVVPISSQIGYTEEISLRPFPRIKTTPTSTSRPSSKSRPSIRRGTVRVSSKTTTTTHLPSLQDIYTDYRETDLEYHADPVEIPITGKVRIHSDGYIECLDMGNFPHPFSCKKFISCAKMEYDSLLGWEYTCPKGLSFDPIGGICNWAAGLGCKE